MERNATVASRPTGEPPPNNGGLCRFSPVRWPFSAPTPISHSHEGGRSTLFSRDPLWAPVAGLKPHQLRQHGLPVRREFWKDARPQRVLRRELGLLERKTALVVGGGDGVGGLEKVVVTMANKLATSLPNRTQMIVVCGKNEYLRSAPCAAAWRPLGGFARRAEARNRGSALEACGPLPPREGPVPGLCPPTHCTPKDQPQLR